MQIRSIRTLNGQAGVGMIEVLVSVLVLAVGLLGLASLQTQSLRFSHDAYLKTQASVLASDMMDRIRANIDTAKTSNAYVNDMDDEPTAVANACEVNACSGVALAAYDFKQWIDNIEAVLPGGDGEISRQVVNLQDEYTVVIEFNTVSNDENSSEPAKSTFIYRTRI